MIEKLLDFPYSFTDKALSDLEEENRANLFSRLLKDVPEVERQSQKGQDITKFRYLVRGSPEPHESEAMYFLNTRCLVFDQYKVKIHRDEYRLDFSENDFTAEEYTKLFSSEIIEFMTLHVFYSKIKANCVNRLKFLALNNETKEIMSLIKRESLEGTVRLSYDHKSLGETRIATKELLTILKTGFIQHFISPEEAIAIHEILKTNTLDPILKIIR